MEIMCACQGIDLRGNKGLGIGSKIAYDIVREKVDKIVDDKVMYKEINKCEDIIKSNIIIDKIENKIGKID